ncbi:CsbD family protein [bacterium]|nr:CsbD family protein [bacterium]
MNKDTAKGSLKQIKGKVREKWGKLTDDDFQSAKGNLEYIKGKVQEKYGIAKDEIEKEFSKLS